MADDSIPIAEDGGLVLPSGESNLKLLVEGSARLSAILDLREVHRALLDIVRRSMPCDGFIVSAFEAESQEIRCCYLWTGGAEVDPTGLPAIKLSASAGMQSRVIRSAQPFVFQDVRQKVLEPDGEYFDIEPSGEVRPVSADRPVTSESAAMAPIRLKGSVVGVIQVMREARAAYSEDHLHLLEGLGYQLGIATQNAELFAQANREIAERARAEEGLRAIQEELQELNSELEARVAARTAELESAIQEMEGFTYSVSHDLRAPLRAISATSSILLDEASESLNEENKELLRRQAKGAIRLGVLIDELLRLSRLSRSEMILSEIDLTRIARDTADELKDRVWSRVPQFEIQAGMRAYGDTQLMRLVLLNLMENALKFSPSGGMVQVGANRVGSFFVKDHGIGFDPAFEAKIWLPFERLVREEEFEGTGIGLANVKRIVERHGGKAYAESAMGAGSTFFVELPYEGA